MREICPNCAKWTKLVWKASNTRKWWNKLNVNAMYCNYCNARLKYVTRNNWVSIVLSVPYAGALFWNVWVAQFAPSSGYEKLEPHWLLAATALFIGSLYINLKYRKLVVFEAPSNKHLQSDAKNPRG